MKNEVFLALATSDEVLSGDAIGAKLNISRVAVNKDIKALIASGIRIDTTAKGYKYIPSDTLSELTLASRLRWANIDIKPIVKVVDSANTYAKTIANAMADDFVVVAPEQTSGRGRLARTFASRIGGVYMTYVKRFEGLMLNDSLNLVLLTGLAVARSLQDYDLAPSIKWPNDVFVGGKKICGILLESTCLESFIDRVFIGIGINVNNIIDDDIHDTAVSMAELLPNKPIFREEIIVKVLSYLDELIANYLKGGQDSFLGEYLALSRTVGHDVSVRNGEQVLRGRAVGLSKLGYLIMDIDGERREIIAGDIIPCER